MKKNLGQGWKIWVKDEQSGFSKRMPDDFYNFLHKKKWKKWTSLGSELNDGLHAGHESTRYYDIFPVAAATLLSPM